MSERAIEFFYDTASPYSYLACTQMEGLEARLGVSVRFRPFLLGGVFKATGNQPPANLPSRGRYMFLDLERWAAYYGVPFRMSSTFPHNTLVFQRALAAVEHDHGQPALRTLTGALYRAVWAEDRDGSDPKTIAEVASTVGLDGAALLERAQASEIKERLRATTDEAVERGVFGAPSFFVGEALFFGNDRLALLEHFVRSGAASRG